MNETRKPGTSFWQRLKAWAMKVSLPGFKKVPVYQVMVFFFREINNDRITLRAASVAFYLILALFPGILFLFTLVPYFPLEGFHETLMGELQSVMPASVFEFLHTAIEDILSVQRFDLLSVGFLTAFFFSTNGVIAIMDSFNKSLPGFRTRSFLFKRWIAIKITFFLALLLIFSVTLIIGGDKLVPWLASVLNLTDPAGKFLLSLIRWILLILLFFFSVATIYFYGPARTEKWRFISTGATVATILSIATSLIFSWVVNYFNLYNKIYGSIGAVLGAMLWFFLNSLVLLIGFELNTAIDQGRDLLSPDSEETHK